MGIHQPVCMIFNSHLPLFRVSHMHKSGSVEIVLPLALYSTCELVSMFVSSIQSVVLKTC